MLLLAVNQKWYYFFFLRNVEIETQTPTSIQFRGNPYGLQLDKRACVKMVRPTYMDWLQVPYCTPHPSCLFQHMFWGYSFVCSPIIITTSWLRFLDLLTKVSFVCWKMISFWKVNSGKSEFLESEFLKSEFRYLAVLWKMNWKTLFSVCLCYGK